MHTLSKYCAVLFFVFLIVPTSAHAEVVEVIRPIDPNTSTMTMRKEAMAEAFGLAVLTEARSMLPDLSEERAEAMHRYFVGHAQPYIQGYKLLSATQVEEGLKMIVDVRVNRRPLREGLKRMGLFETVKAPVAAAVSWPENISEDDLMQLHSLITLTGVELTDEVLPAFTLEYTDEKTYKGKMEAMDAEWIRINQDMASVWFGLWSRYFAGKEQDTPDTGGRALTINGWFSPDGVLEFDRVMRGWDSAVQDSRLLEMDMQPTGVGATWDVTVLNEVRLNMLLQSFLPQRGLSYHFGQDGQ